MKLKIERFGDKTGDGHGSNSDSSYKDRNNLMHMCILRTRPLSIKVAHGMHCFIP